MTALKLLSLLLLPAVLFYRSATVLGARRKLTTIAEMQNDTTYNVLYLIPQVALDFVVGLDEDEKEDIRLWADDYRKSGEGMTGADRVSSTTMAKILKLQWALGNLTEKIAEHEDAKYFVNHVLETGAYMGAAYLAGVPVEMEHLKALFYQFFQYYSYKLDNNARRMLETKLREFTDFGSLSILRKVKPRWMSDFSNWADKEEASTTPKTGEQVYVVWQQKEDIKAFDAEDKTDLEGEVQEGSDKEVHIGKGVVPAGDEKVELGDEGDEAEEAQ